MRSTTNTHKHIHKPSTCLLTKIEYVTTIWLIIMCGYHFSLQKSLKSFAYTKESKHKSLRSFKSTDKNHRFQTTKKCALQLKT